jgi:glycosyltransferase involved in cell wall biosynthesis
LTPRPQARADIRRAMGTADETVVIAMAARMEAQKGHEQLIESLKLIPGNGWQAWILGGPQNASERAYMDALQARSESLGGRIRFLGDRPDVDAWLQAADVYCQPNRSPDSFGLSFVEALSAGLPVVTTNIGGAAEIVTNTCGVLTMAESPSEVASALGILIEDRAMRLRMGEAARERVREFCDLPRSVRRLADLLGCVARPSTTAA